MTKQDLSTTTTAKNADERARNLQNEWFATKLSHTTSKKMLSNLNLLYAAAWHTGYAAALNETKDSQQ